MLLIAEIGNCHFGDYETAKEMIRVATGSGAGAVKFQAFNPETISGGSMPKEFYQKCAFNLEQCKGLIDLGRKIGVEVFFSIFDSSFDELIPYQKNRRKISGSQTVKTIESGGFLDHPKAFVSFPESHLIHAANLEKATPLLVTPYLTSDPKLYLLDYLARMRGYYGHGYGYSDHTRGILACEVAAKRYGVEVIEKHFTLQKDMQFNGVVFRDTVHGATPEEFYKLAKRIGL